MVRRAGNDGGVTGGEGGGGEGVDVPAVAGKGGEEEAWWKAPWAEV